MDDFFVRNRLSAYLDGELPTAEARDVEAALARNPALRAEYEQLREIAEELRIAGPIAPSARFKARLSERLAAEPMPAAWRRWLPRVPLEGLALAAVALFALVLVSKPKTPELPAAPVAPAVEAPVATAPTAADTTAQEGVNPVANGVLGDEARPLNTAGRQSMIPYKKTMPPTGSGSKVLSEKEPYLSAWEQGDNTFSNVPGGAITNTAGNTATNTGGQEAAKSTTNAVAYSPPPYRYRLRTGSETALKTLASIAAELGGTLVDERGRALPTYPMEAGEARAVKVVVPSYNVEALHARLRQMGDVETMASDPSLLYASGADVPVAIEVERD